jgi:hypothetical protein
MSEIYGSTTLENKLAIESVGDVVAEVRGRPCVVSALGFEHKMTGHDTRLLAKEIGSNGDRPTPNTPRASAAIQQRIDAVDWPAWPTSQTALPQR